MKTPAKYVSITVLVLVSAVLLMAGGAALFGTEGETKGVVTAVPPSLPKVEDIDQNQLFTLTNKERTDRGLPVLALNQTLNASALAKCQDMVQRDYWGHKTPDGQESWVLMESINYLMAGENLAYGYYDASATVKGWMDSPSHKEELLRPNYEFVGYAVCLSENYRGAGNHLIIVQHFADLP